MVNDAWLHKIEQDVAQQNRETIKAAIEVLTALLEEPPEVEPRAGREVVRVERRGRVTYQLEKVKCGKRGCKCQSGELHGPYWYSYCKAGGGKLKSKYEGKELFPRGQN